MRCSGYAVKECSPLASVTSQNARSAAAFSADMYLELENILDIVEFFLISAIDALAIIFYRLHRVMGLNQCDEPQNGRSKELGWF